MKNTLLWIAGAVGVFFVWQWWISRRNPQLEEAEAARKAADRAGQLQEAIQLQSRPRPMSDEGAWILPAILKGKNIHWPQLIESGISVWGSPTAQGVELNPFVFGYGKN